MAEDKSMRLSQVAKILNKGLSSVASTLSAKGFKVEINPNTKINTEQLEVLAKEFKASDLLNGTRKSADVPASAEAHREAPARKDDDYLPRYSRDEQGRSNVAESNTTAPAGAPVARTPEPAKPTAQPAQREAAPASGLPGLTVVGKIDLNAPRPVPPVQAERSPAPAPVTAKAPEAPKPVVAPAPEAKAPAPVSVPAPAVAPVAPPQPVATPAPKPVEAPAPTPAPVAVVKPAPAPAVVQTPKPVENRQPEQPKPTVEVPKTVETPQPVAAVTPPVAAPKPVDVPKSEPADEPAAPVETIRAEGSVQLKGLTVKGTIDLTQFNRPQGGGAASRDKKGKRKRIPNANDRRPGQPNPGQGQGGGQPQAGGQGQVNAPRNDRDGQPRGDRPGYQGGDRNQNQGDRTNQNRPAQGQGAGNATTNTNRPAAGAPAGNNQNRPAAGAGGGTNQGRNSNGPRPGGGNDKKRGGDRRDVPTKQEVSANIRATNARMTGGNTRTNRGADRRRDRRSQREEDRRLMTEQEELEAKTLKVTEFVSANDLSSLMDVSINEVISVCLSAGMFVSINQRLDAEAITFIADEFGFDIQFVSAEEETEASLDETPDAEEDLHLRAPIVTIMGHVDHGKTSLLDYIRRAKVAAGEAGGITQHIGAYSVKTEDGRMVTFLDTPGHEAFTAMRARGAKVTDVVIIVIAADDSIMPQTREAINHAQVANVPIVFAFSKVDKPGADAEKIRNELAQMNLLVEDWGGKYQSQEISSKSGLGIDELLEKVLLEAEVLELKANPSRRSTGTVVEATLDKGRGYVTTVLVQNGTLRQGDIMLVGAHYGRIRAMTNDRGERIKEAGPSQPVQILGLPGAPQAGDKFNVMETDREAREIANKREQLLREQTLRTRKHITLEEIGRRKAIGSFKELNVIVKGDVDGSVEALSDSLLQLSTGEVQVNIIHKAVGQISESDVLLASTADAIIIGFQVRPSSNARKLAEQEQIEIRMYSIIYDAINEIKDAMEGLLAPTQEEVITGNIEVREVFKISKIGTVAGCYVTDGVVKRNHKIRIIRDFIVIHTGEISALKRYKDDVNEVRTGYECGLSIKGFNDIEVGDVIEGFEMKEVKRTLA
ncbi:translation initiation factor IF-2 [Fibrella forsythiae]|uniref:Translation initiation factor IF-2 n=1 Tax=Fibrella forsythiae TaxID=2817061 RepID=A0ABS3JFX3_9BACT|nr:translation initiation factor IF-2 [Fibrella forsythiae]MBO0948897.1 translation initiation factor IF-2 [Fibrella forsythiae]